MTSKKSTHLGKITGAGVNPQKDPNVVLFGAPSIGAQASDSPLEQQPVEVVSRSKPPAKKNMLRAVYMTPKLVAQLNQYRILELNMNTDSKAIVHIIKDTLTQHGYWGPEFDDED